MATGSSASFGLQYHARSISLPSRLNPKIEAEIHKLTSSFSTIAPSCSTETTTIASLVGLADRELYTFAEQLIQYPQTQQAILRRYQHGVLVEEALEGSVGLLDWCGRIRDPFITMKERVRALQSALRRKSGDERNISAYISFRKKVKKDVGKSLRALKHMGNKLTKKSHHLLDDDHHQDHHHLSIVILKVLREATAITISVFRSPLDILVLSGFTD